VASGDHLLGTEVTLVEMAAAGDGAALRLGQTAVGRVRSSR
jgi:hypothetical protein